MRQDSHRGSNTSRQDLQTLSQRETLDRAALLVAIVNQASAELTRTVRHGDTTGAAEADGLRTMQSWLRGHAHLSPAEAGRLVRSGRALEHLPATAAAFAAGAVTTGQVATIAPVAADEALAAAARLTPCGAGITGLAVATAARLRLPSGWPG